MIAFLTESDVGEGFDQIVDFLNAHTIQYALMANPPIYVSCIKQFWASVLVKKTNDVVKLQALIDRKKVVVTEDTIRQDLRLDEADGVECLPNEEIFTELARMGYEKPPPKLTFYKAFFSAQWKFLIHTIVHCRKFNFSKYIFESMVRNVDSPSKFLMIGKGFLGVETSLFDTMLVQHQADVEDDDDDDEVSNAPTPPSPPPAPPSSPAQEQPTQPTNTSESSMTLHNTLMETCATLTQKVAHLEQNKVAQALEITKLKIRVKRLERNGRLKHFSLKRLTKVVEMDADIQEKMEEDVTAVKEINAAESEPIVFDDEEMQEKHLNNIKKYHNLKRKPISVAQARKNMIVYLKNIARYKIAHFKGVTYDQVRPIFEREYNKVQTFLKPDRDEEPVKKRGVEETLLQESFKMLRAEVEASGSRTYWKIIRVGIITQAYMSFDDMLKDIDKEDLDALWRLTKEKFSTSMPTEDKEKALLIELKRLYEPNAAEVL
nr:hypothetical protein [Tanacetum cinerariifolium]